MRLAVLRPDPDGERTASALRGVGHEVLVAPLLRMTPLAAEHLEGPWAALLITSVNAIRAIAAYPALAQLVRHPVLAVGDHTAEYARATGFVDVLSARGNAADLAVLAAAQCGSGHGRLLYLTGEDRAFDMSAALAPHGILVETAIVYRMEMEQKFPAGLAEALRRQSVDGVLHYSPRSAAAYLLCASDSDLRQAALAPRHYCLSEQVAAPFVAAGAAQVRVARQPDEASLFRLVDAD